MGYDMVHLGFQHGQVVLWGGTGRQLIPGDKVRLSSDITAAVGDPADYDVAVDRFTVPVRDRIIRTGAQPVAAITLTSGGTRSAGDDDALADRRAEQSVMQTQQLFDIFGLDEDAGAALKDAEAAEGPAGCDFCAHVRRQH